MPNLHDIERRINSVNSTKKITRTMEMVAAAKIRFASERVEKATPYSNSMAEMLADVATRVGGAENALLKKHDEVKNVLLVVMVSDRGLAGGFNSNILREAEHLMKAKAAEGAQCHVVACGKKAIGYFAYRGILPEMQFAGLSADPTFDEATRIASYVRDKYATGQVDEVLVFYNHTRNAADQDPRVEQLLPIDVSSISTPGTGAEATFDFEPNEAAVLDRLLPAYVETMVYHALIDSAAGEQGARRKAMKSATDNATEIINTLQRQFNRARQGAITTELTEIVAGAAAQKKEE